MQISVVTPAYKCSECIEELYNRLIKTFKNMKIDDFEIIYVNDGSPHNDWEIIKKLTEKDKKVKGINLSRNFGQHNAITAGLDFAEGEWVVVMDCDLQDQPEEIEKLYNKAMEGYDVVFGRRYERKDKFFKKLSSKAFNVVFTYLTDRKIDNTVANFSIINKKVVKEYRKIKEQSRTYGLFIIWLGFKNEYVDVEHLKREKGKSAYTFKKSLNLALNIVISHSNKPLRIFIKAGFIFSSLSFIYGLILIIRYFIYKIPIAGWTSTMVSLYFIGGLILANMGILGIYIGKIFDEVKNRQLYVYQEKINF